MANHLTPKPKAERPEETSIVDAEDFDQTDGRPYSGLSEPSDEAASAVGIDDTTDGRPYSGK